MRSIVLLAVLACAAAQADMPTPGHDTKAPTGKLNPLLAVVVTQCNQLLSGYFMYPDGKSFTVSAEDKWLPWDKLVEIYDSASQRQRYDMDCEKVGHDSAN